MKKTPIIGIYHHPQECGDPFIALVSQSTGEVLETLTIPEDYYWSGEERVDICTPVRTFTEHICQGGSKPTVENVRVPSTFRRHPKDHKFRPIEVTITHYDPTIIPTWDADILVEEYIPDFTFKYDPDKDTFSQTLESQGIPMAEWPLPVRQKTNVLDFLRSVLSSYKDYHLVNLIQIG